MGSSDTQGELWGRDPANWRDLQEGFSIPLWDAMLTATGVGPGSRFLDAGCGAGGASVMAHDRGAAVTGVDASDPLLEVARHRVPTGDFRVADLELLPFEPDSFDSIIAVSSIQYAENPNAATRELERVVAPDGRISVGLFSTADKVEYRVVFDAIRESLQEPQPEQRAVRSLRAGRPRGTRGVGGFDGRRRRRGRLSIHVRDHGIVLGWRDRGRAGSSRARHSRGCCPQTVARRGRGTLPTIGRKHPVRGHTPLRHRRARVTLVLEIR